MSGTSMATPVVAGSAAVLKTYFPQLTPADLKRIILASAAPWHTQVLKPGTKELVDFATLSRTGGVVNLYEAVRLASALPTQHQLPLATSSYAKRPRQLLPRPFLPLSASHLLAHQALGSHAASRRHPHQVYPAGQGLQVEGLLLHGSGG